MKRRDEGTGGGWEGRGGWEELKGGRGGGGEGGEGGKGSVRMLGFDEAQRSAGLRMQQLKNG